MGCRGGRSVWITSWITVLCLIGADAGNLGVYSRADDVTTRTGGSPLNGVGRRRLLLQLNSYRQLESNASNMNRLRWLDILEQRAFDKAESHCAGSNDTDAVDYLYTIQGAHNATQPDLQDAMERWWSEGHAHYHYDTAMCDSNYSCQQYKQMVWAQTELVGCSYSQCAESAMTSHPANGTQTFAIVCVFNETSGAGTPYQVGTQCSDCQLQGSSCGPDGLCRPFGDDLSMLLNRHIQIRSLTNATNMEMTFWDPAMDYLVEEYAAMCDLRLSEKVSWPGEMLVLPLTLYPTPSGEPNVAATIVDWWNQCNSSECSQRDMVLYSKMNKMACAISACASVPSYVLVCLYTEPYNSQNNVSLYSEGPACTDCPVYARHCNSLHLCQNSSTTTMTTESSIIVTTSTSITETTTMSNTRTDNNVTENTPTQSTSTENRTSTEIIMTLTPTTIPTSNTTEITEPDIITETSTEQSTTTGFTTAANNTAQTTTTPIMTTSGTDCACENGGTPAEATPVCACKCATDFQGDHCQEYTPEMMRSVSAHMKIPMSGYNQWEDIWKIFQKDVMDVLNMFCLTNKCSDKGMFTPIDRSHVHLAHGYPSHNGSPASVNLTLAFWVMVGCTEPSTGNRRIRRQAPSGLERLDEALDPSLLRSAISGNISTFETHLLDCCNVTLLSVTHTSGVTTSPSVLEPPGVPIWKWVWAPPVAFLFVIIAWVGYTYKRPKRKRRMRSSDNSDPRFRRYREDRRSWTARDIDAEFGRIGSVTSNRIPLRMTPYDHGDTDEMSTLSARYSSHSTEHGLRTRTRTHTHKHGDPRNYCYPMRPAPSSTRSDYISIYGDATAVDESGTSWWGHLQRHNPTFVHGRRKVSADGPVLNRFEQWARSRSPETSRRSPGVVVDERHLERMCSGMDVSGDSLRGHGKPLRRSLDNRWSSGFGEYPNHTENDESLDYGGQQHYSRRDSTGSHHSRYYDDHSDYCSEANSERHHHHASHRRIRSVDSDDRGRKQLNRRSRDSHNRSNQRRNLGFRHHSRSSAHDRNANGNENVKRLRSGNKALSKQNKRHQIEECLGDNQDTRVQIDEELSCGPSDSAQMYDTHIHREQRDNSGGRMDPHRQTMLSLSSDETYVSVGPFQQFRR